MRLLFAFFDYSETEDTGNDPRGPHNCQLIFSTTHNYLFKRSVRKTTNAQAGDYILSCAEKPAAEQLPEDFWTSAPLNSQNPHDSRDHRIYNVTAIVGDNGTGKSTILRNIIKTFVYGLTPNVPFLLLLQKTDSEELIGFYGGFEGGAKFVSEGFSVAPAFTCEYPADLEKAKIMLIDNTLSLASIDFDHSSSEAFPYFNQQKEDDKAPEVIGEQEKQFYNKSLVASLRYSNAMSAARRPLFALPVEEQLGIHFRYESYQELRFLFDRFQQSTISTLIDNHYPFPNPRYIKVSAYSAEELIHIYRYTNRTKERVIPEVITKEILLLKRYGFPGILLADALLSLFVVFYDYFRDHLETAADIEALEQSCKEFTVRDADQAMKPLAISILNKYQALFHIGRDTPGWYQSVYHCCKTFISFITKNEAVFTEVFQPVHTGISSTATKEDADSVRQIDVEKTRSDKQKLKYVIDFLENYRRASCFTYFLSFSSGLSSGEKNMLRMLTQLRYALDGPSTYSDNATEDNTGDFLRNRAFRTNQHGPYIYCDTLFFFLDEADLTYHPEWQRQFVSLLTAILPKIFRDPYSSQNKELGCRDIQVILATHSPLMLGDFPKASCLYLKRNNAGLPEVDQSARQSSFGQNIYIMLRDDFFMEDSIGCFAMQKINEIASWCGEQRPKLQAIREKERKKHKKLSKSDRETRMKCSRKITEYRHTVNLLAPGIIRNKLLMELEGCERLAAEEGREEYSFCQ